MITEIEPSADDPFVAETSQNSLILQPMGNIFLPMFLLKDSTLHVVVLKTYGRGVRYFNSPRDPLLQQYNVRVGKALVKQAAPVVVAEAFTWNVSYSIGTINDPYYLNTGVRTHYPHHDFISLPVTKVESLFGLNAPLEFKAAVLNVAFKELAKI